MPTILACSSLTFSQLSLSEALAAIRHLGFDAVELGALEGWAHVSPSALARDLDAETTRARLELDRNGLWCPAINAGLGTRSPTEVTDRMESLSRFARSIGAKVITLGASPRADEDTASPLTAEAHRLAGLSRISQAHGVQLSVEGHVGTITEDPHTAAELCRRVPGLGLTLDPSHYWAGKAGGKGWRETIPFVAQVHLRDAGLGGWDDIQVAPGKGVVDFPAVLAALAERAYGGTFGVEYIDNLPVKEGTNAKEAAGAMARLARVWGIGGKEASS